MCGSFCIDERPFNCGAAVELADGGPPCRAGAAARARGRAGGARRGAEKGRENTEENCEIIFGKCYMQTAKYLYAGHSCERCEKVI